MDAVKNFNPNNPEFIKTLQERNKKNEAEFEKLKQREKLSEQRMVLERWILVRDLHDLAGLIVQYTD